MYVRESKNYHCHKFSAPVPKELIGMIKSMTCIINMYKESRNTNWQSFLPHRRVGKEMYSCTLKVLHSKNARPRRNRH
jgi:hypothetical protein